MKELNEIIKNLKEVNKQNNLSISDDILFENAIDIFISDRINAKKFPLDSPYIKVSKPINELNNEKEPSKPSEKQINFMKKNKILTPLNLTRRKATAIINEWIEKHPRR